MKRTVSITYDDTCTRTSSVIEQLVLMIQDDGFLSRAILSMSYVNNGARHTINNTHWDKRLHPMENRERMA